MILKGDFTFPVPDSRNTSTYKIYTKYYELITCKQVTFLSL